MSTVRDDHDLAVQALLDTMVSCRRVADQQEANLLALTLDYLALHPATGPAGLGTPSVSEDAVVTLGATPP
jgi:hypothetical protein